MDAADEYFRKRPTDMITRYVSSRENEEEETEGKEVSPLSVAGWTCSLLLDGYDTACCGGTRTPSLSFNALRSIREDHVFVLFAESVFRSVDRKSESP